MDTYMAPYASSLFLTSWLRQVDTRFAAGCAEGVEGYTTRPPHGLLRPHRFGYIICCRSSAASKNGHGI